MSDFFKNPLSSSSTDGAARKQAIMDQVRNELAQANAQQLMNNMNERCFKACVTKPGDSLSSAEQTCLTRCLDRFMETFNVVSRTYVARLAKERSESESAPFS
ncbi:Tim10/DDP family zinc finger-domain-containing protein [Lentinula aff. detonsa]|nr:Tim10/DDP family zinc finger-domain-containing protein [Lentinula aff. detonsa]